MKTTNNIQKTALKSATAATLLTIISFTVNAQVFLRPLFEKNETGNIAMVTGKMSNNSFTSPANTGSLTDADAFATYLVKETEEQLRLEDWMFNETNFATIFQFETETESPLELEGWMTNESNFDVNSFSLEIEKEEELHLEDWMINPKVWER